ncbi:MAG: class B sortase [Candidatus Gastranaerophilaceae bacterium]
MEKREYAMKRFALICMILFCAVIFVFGGYQLYLQLSEYAEGENTYSGLEDFVALPAPSETTPKPMDEEEPIPSIAWPEVDFAELSAINPDIVGWLYCEDTVINYPVAQTDDNSYYLNHLFDGTYNANGCLFLGCRTGGDFSDPHSIIYGHHMKNGSMFSSLDGYKKQEYFDAHPQLLLVTPGSNFVIELFAGYVASVRDDAWQIQFSDEFAMEAWLEAAIEKSTFESGMAPLPADRIITLSTCSYEFSNARFVVHGILREY